MTFLGHARHLRRVAQHRQGRGAHGGRTTQDAARSQERFDQGFSTAPPSHPRRLSADRYFTLTDTAVKKWEVSAFLLVMILKLH